MAISRTPRNETQADEPMFADPIAQVFEDVDNEFNGKGASEQKDDKYEALAKQLSDLQTQMAETQRANMALMQQPQSWGQSQVTEPQYTDPNTIPLPDPAVDYEGYERALTQRIELRQANVQKKTEFAAQRDRKQNDQVEDLYAGFTEKYPDYAEDRERLDFISLKLAKQAQKRGVDVSRYMFVTQDKFMSDVVTEYNKIFGEPETDDDNDDQDTRRASSRPAPRSRARNRNRQEEGDVGRTGGVFGGSESGGRPSRSRNNDDENGPSMIDDLQAIQRRTGFY